MHVLAMQIELRFPAAQSLKAKRALLRPIVDGAEVDHQDTWQRSSVGVSIVSASATKADELMDEVERFVWSHPDLEVLSAERQWMEMET
jgi:uncharacterized protein YlxP (DUF503 family)